MPRAQPTVIEALASADQAEQKIKATKHEKFLKIAGRRVASALRAIEVIGNCANTAMYEYTPEEVNRIFESMRDLMCDTELKFQPKTRHKFGHNFFDGEPNA